MELSRVEKDMAWSQAGGLLDILVAMPSGGYGMFPLDDDARNTVGLCGTWNVFPGCAGTPVVYYVAPSLVMRARGACSSCPVHIKKKFTTTPSRLSSLARARRVADTLSNTRLATSYPQFGSSQQCARQRLGDFTARTYWGR